MKKALLLLFCITVLPFSLFASPWNHILKDYSITDIEPYENGYWVATESNGAFRYDATAHKWFRYNKDNGVMSENDNVNDMKIMGGKVWFATNYGIYTCSLEGNNWKHDLLPPGDYFSNWVRAFDATSEKVYIAAFTGLYTYSFSSNSFTEIGNLKPDYYQTSYTNSIYAADSIVWIGTDDGVFRYDTSMPISNDSSITYYSKNNGIPTTSDLVMCRSLYANEHGLWLGLDEYTSTQAPNYCQGGLFSFDGNIWEKYDETTGLPADGIHFIQEYDNKIYAGLFHYVDGVNFEGAGMLVLDLNDSSWTVLDDTNWHIGNDSIRSFFCTETDTLVSTDHGLFTNLNDLPDLAPFDAPEWFSVRAIADNKMEITVAPVYLADRYIVHIEMATSTVFEDIPINKTRDTLELTFPNAIYRVMVHAANEHGNGPYCKDILTVRSSGSRNPVLLIQGYDKEIQGNTYDHCFTHSYSMYEAGVGFDAISDEALLETDIDPNQYEMIDWICGVDNDILTSENKQIISSYLEAGGKLFISGSQLIEGVTGVNLDAEFYNGYLKAAWKKSDARTYDVETIASGIFNGLNDFSFDDGSMIFDVERPDGFKPLGNAESCLLYSEKDSSSYGSAALQYTGTFGESAEEAQLVYMGFPLEAMFSDSLRKAVMLCVLDYFDFDVSLTAIDNTDIPNSVELKQNYPNPFNPLTTISLQLTVNGETDLAIYDLSGKKIISLINGFRSAGKYEFEWNATEQASGVYICRLQIGEFVRSMKMVLLK